MISERKTHDRNLRGNRYDGRSSSQSQTHRRRPHALMARESLAKLRPLQPVLMPLVIEPRWLVWRWELTEKGNNWTKVPYRAAAPDQKASSTNPQSWSDYETARHVVAEG